jgi:hypothetical protein
MTIYGTQREKDHEKQQDHQDINVKRRGRGRGTKAINMEGSEKGDRR